MKSIHGIFFDINDWFINIEDFNPENVETSIIKYHTELPEPYTNKDERIQLKYKDDSPNSLKIRSILKEHKVFDDTKEKIVDIS